MRLTFPNKKGEKKKNEKQKQNIKSCVKDLIFQIFTQYFPPQNIKLYYFINTNL